MPRAGSRIGVLPVSTINPPDTEMRALLTEGMPLAMTPGRRKMQ